MNYLDLCDLGQIGLAALSLEFLRVPESLEFFLEYADSLFNLLVFDKLQIYIYKQSILGKHK